MSGDCRRFSHCAYDWLYNVLGFIVQLSNVNKYLIVLSQRTIHFEQVHKRQCYLRIVLPGIGDLTIYNRRIIKSPSLFGPAGLSQRRKSVKSLGYSSVRIRVRVDLTLSIALRRYVTCLLYTSPSPRDRS